LLQFGIIKQESGYIAQTDAKTFICLLGEQKGIEEGDTIEVRIPDNLPQHATEQAAREAYCDGITLLHARGAYPITYTTDEG